MSIESGSGSRMHASKFGLRLLVQDVEESTTVNTGDVPTDVVERPDDVEVLSSGLLVRGGASLVNGSATSQNSTFVMSPGMEWTLAADELGFVLKSSWPYRYSSSLWEAL